MRPLGFDFARTALALSVLLLAAPARSQNEGQTYGAFLDRVDVEVVNVDVVVTDRAGRPVLGLQRADFQLFVDGRPVALDYFAGPKAIAAGAAAAATAPAPAEPQPGASAPAAATAVPASLIVYIDQVALQPGRRNLALREIEGFLETRLGQLDRAMVAVFEENLRIVSPFTSDLAELKGALQQVGKIPISGGFSAAQRRFLLQDIQSESSSDINAPIVAESLRQSIQVYVQTEVDRQRRSVAALGNLLSTLAGVDGRKAVLMASAGLSERPGALLSATLRAKFGGAELDDETAFGQEANALRHEYDRMLRTAQGIRVAFYTIDAGEGENLISAENAGSADVGGGGNIDASAIEARANLRRLSDETGGRNFILNTKLDQQLPEIVADLESAYSLGFNLPAELASGYHRIRVRAADPDLELRHREGFRARGAGEQATDAVMAAAALSVAGNPLGVKATAGEPKAAARGKAKLVPVSIQVPLSGLAFLPEGDHQAGRLAFQFALRDPGDRLMLLEARQLPLTIPNARLAQALAQHVSYAVELPLSPGRHRVAVGVHDEIGDGRSTVLLDVEVPAGR